MLAAMLTRLVRQIGAMILALGVILSGIVPAGAMPSMPPHDDAATPGMSAMMPGMTMAGDCTTMTTRSLPSKGAPCKSPDNNGCAAVCSACALPAVLLNEAMPISLLLGRNRGTFAYDVNRKDISTPPALPPPIFLT